MIWRALILFHIILSTVNAADTVNCPTFKFSPPEVEVLNWKHYPWTDSRYHNDNSFAYRVFAINTGYSNTRSPEETFDHLIHNKLSGPGPISLSIINESNIRMYGVYGFILDIPAERIIAASPSDMRSWRDQYGTSEWAQTMYREFGLPAPATVLQNIRFNDYSEILYWLDRGPPACRIRVQGIVASPGIDGRLRFALGRLAQRLRLPFIILKAHY